MPIGRPVSQLTGRKRLVMRIKLHIVHGRQIDESNRPAHADNLEENMRPVLQSLAKHVLAAHATAS